MQSSSNIIIRKASVADICTIQAIAYKTWPAAYKDILSKDRLDYMLDYIYSTKALKRQMEQEAHQFIIANETDDAVAFADYGLIEANIWKLFKLYALPEQQGKGLGKLLINYIIEEIKNFAATALRLNVNRQNKAKQFYEHLDFKVLYKEDVDIGNGYFMNDYVMEKKLGI